MMELLESRRLLSSSPITPIPGITGNSQYPAAPPITTTYSNGTGFTLGSVTQPIVVLDFWANWCPWCMGGMPGTQALSTWAQQTASRSKLLR